MRAARLRERQTLRDDRVDLALAQQLDQRAEVLAEPLRVAGLAAHGAVSPPHVVTELLDLVLEHSPAGRQLAPEPYGRDRRIPFDHRRPVLVPVRQRGVAAEYDKPSARPQRA